MPYRDDIFAPGEVCHVYTRGVARQNIFLSNKHRLRFLKLLIHCLPQRTLSFSTTVKLKRKIVQTKEGEGLINLLGYCLMDNHIHLLLQENVENGVSHYMQRLLNSYAKYFNMSRNRSGTLFTTPFKAVPVEADEQLLHVMRYIHLNPYVAHMTEDPLSYRWSSLGEYISKPVKPLCHTPLITSMLTPDEHLSFVKDEADYARSLADVQHLLIDDEQEIT